MSQAFRPVGAAAAADDPHAIRRAGREVLSLALIDARNALLRALAADESAVARRRALRAGWYQEWWIGRHLQRGRGEGCDPDGPRLAGVEPAVDDWLAPGTPPPADAVRQYLAQTLEVTLDLLHGSAEDDDALFFFRQSLQHEDRVVEALRLALAADAPPSRARREPLWLPAQRWVLGGGDDPAAVPPGFVPWPERGGEAVAVPEGEIDAQPVDWGRWAEFAEDGGYDREDCWSPAGWAWLQGDGRRAPHRVEGWRGGVVVRRGRGAATRLEQAAAAQPATHLTRFEADAWCRWAGRRLPTEVEWEIAACRAGGRGFVWGDVAEWVAAGARSWPGAGPPPPGAVDDAPGGDTTAVLRGAGLALARRWHHPRSRRFVAPTADRLAAGFRSCAP